MKQSIVIRKSTVTKNKNHNLYKNGASENAMWWCYFTVSDGVRITRQRFSLKTHDLIKARKLRDKIIQEAESSDLILWL